MACGVERLDVSGGVGHDLLCGAFRDAHPGRFGDQADRFVEGTAHRGPDQAATDLIGPATGGESELGVERVHARGARGAVADPADGDLAEEGQDPPGAAPPPLERCGPAGRVEDHDGPEVAAAAGVEVGLQREADQLAPAPFALGFEHAEPLAGLARLGEEPFQVPERFEPAGGLRAHGNQYATG